MRNQRHLLKPAVLAILLAGQSPAVLSARAEELNGTGCCKPSQPATGLLPWLHSRSALPGGCGPCEQTTSQAPGQPTTGPAAPQVGRFATAPEAGTPEPRGLFPNIMGDLLYGSRSVSFPYAR